MMRIVLLFVLIAFCSLAVRAEYLDADTIDRVTRNDSLAPLHGNWLQQLMQTNFRINDPRIQYPRFPKFCLKVYNWGDKTFNSYDPAYVSGTGKNWKLYVKSENWNQSYHYVFSLFNRNNVSVRSAINCDLGISLNFMAVGLSYTRAMDKSIYGSKNNRRTFDFSFTCSRFSAEVLSQKTKGNTFVDRFGDYEDGKYIHMPFEGLTQSQSSVTAFYFFNHNKYSQAAAYCYSKYQLKSAGSFIGGLRWGSRKLVMDFSDLPDEMKAANPEFPLISSFKYTEYSILTGYAHNWVLNKHLLLNVTAMPCFGYRKSELHDFEHNRREMLSANILARMSLTYNYKLLFCGLVMKFDGGFILNKNYEFFNSTQYATAIVGIRF